MEKEEAISVPAGHRLQHSAAAAEMGSKTTPSPPEMLCRVKFQRYSCFAPAKQSQGAVKWLGWCQSRERLCWQRSILLHCPLLQTLKQNNVESDWSLQQSALMSQKLSDRGPAVAQMTAVTWNRHPLIRSRVNLWYICINPQVMKFNLQSMAPA